MSKIILQIIVLFGLILLCPVGLASARLGVGIGAGKITVDQNLKPGLIYVLPPLPVSNTGDVAAQYNISIEYHQDQPQKKPSPGWFAFSPQDFKLEPGAATLIQVKLNLPVNAEPGEYFAYLEAHPLKSNVINGETSIGVAAAAKLYFTIEPANLLYAIYYRLESFWMVYQPWTSVAAGTILFFVICLVIRKYLRINIQIHPKQKNEK